MCCCNAQQYHTTPHNTTQHHTTQHNTTQHNTTPHNTTPHNTTPHYTTSWTRAIRSFQTTLCLRFQPQQIACACLYLAAHHIQIPLQSLCSFPASEVVNTPQPVLSGECCFVFQIGELSVEHFKSFLCLCSDCDDSGEVVQQSGEF